MSNYGNTGLTLEIQSNYQILIKHEYLNSEVGLIWTWWLWARTTDTCISFFLHTRWGACTTMIVYLDWSLLRSFPSRCVDLQRSKPITMGSHTHGAPKKKKVLGAQPLPLLPSTVNIFEIIDFSHLTADLIFFETKSDSRGRRNIF